MKSLIRILSAAALLSLAASCGPSRYTVPVEMRHPSKSGIDLSGKTVSMVYLDNGNARNSAVGEAFAGGFADALEEAYGTGEGSVGVYKIETKPDAAYASNSGVTIQIAGSSETARLGSILLIDNVILNYE